MRRRQVVAAAGTAAATALLGCGISFGHASRPPTYGLDFPGSAGVRRTMRFRFEQPLPAYPATYIWRAYPRRQAGYYTAFFWGNDDGKGTLDTFLWAPGRDADSYYGAHPYPVPPPRGADHRWEIAIDRADILGAPVVYDRWYTQAMRVWGDRRGKHHEFFWDLPFTDPWHMVEHSLCRSWGEARPPRPVLTWGDAPWAPGNEVWNGVLGDIQIYSAKLNRAELLREAERPGSTAVGAASMWYLNLELAPGDIGDRSGCGNHPVWVGDERPKVWRA